ncbi:Phylloquinone omega-hydroxylase CYP4F2 [Choanephora cucurbitarum]|uniref:Phylloquinone omega-hydroxylase CYP4F2 n=1 Tax=Choanephora cucurbitarum TaxID=101091 RepID=A0A1C7N669_9FUNG|nr:Phylloquinone omega-hydroxylase CYP4F2 [Choanephora cucurbitarum]
MFTETALQIYHQMAEKVLPILKRQPKSSYIGAALVFLLVAEIRRQLSVPKHLKKFPTIGVFTLMKSFMRNDSVIERHNRLVAPIVKQGHKFYAAKIPFDWSLSIVDPEIAKIMLMKSDAFPKSQGFTRKLGDSSLIVRFTGRDNVSISNGHVWKRQRKFMNPAFRRSTPIKTFGELTLKFFDCVDEQPQDFPAAIKLKNYTLDALGIAAFDFDFKSLSGDPEGWTEIYNVIMKGMFDPWVFLFGKMEFILQYIIPSKRECIKSVVKFNKMLVEMADKRRQEIQNGKKLNTPNSEKDLLTLMIEAEMEEGIMTTNEELRENIALFFLAGQDSTGNSLSFCLYHLAKNKHVQDKLRREIMSVMGDRDLDAIPTVEDFKDMPYLNMVIKENLRLSGPADRFLDRVVAEDIVLGGELIPKGTLITVDVASIHYNPEYWHDPEVFIPERFEPNGEFDQHAGVAWLPFSNGARQCIGMNFSLAEQRVFLTMLLRRYEVGISKDSIHYDSIVYEQSFTFAPSSLTLNFTKLN